MALLSKEVYQQRIEQAVLVLLEVEAIPQARLEVLIYLSDFFDEQTSPVFTQIEEIFRALKQLPDNWWLNPVLSSDELVLLSEGLLSLLVMENQVPGYGVEFMGTDRFALLIGKVRQAITGL